MKTCVVTATYGCAPNKVWLYMTNPTLNSWNPTVASAEVDLEGMHIVEKNKDGTTTDIHFDKLDKPRRISCTFTRGKIRGAFYRHPAGQRRFHQPGMHAGCGRSWSVRQAAEKAGSVSGNLAQSTG